MNDMELVRLKETLSEAALHDKISCAKARALAEQLGLSYKQVGEAANELGIKIHSCQLGCF